ncbi:hypothetical protein [Streptomyces sp. LUP47B]|uniref:hypothetical protein n=1 Tax=Streptomyces sp. LUP47B TaxID=1890286 RepID=UPI0008518825|nr:hypothetical protein [Streptomyces sp. LUP47B]
MRAGPSARNSHQGDGLEGGIPRLLLFQSTLIDDKTLRWTMERMQAAASAEGTVGVREGEEVVRRQATGVPGQPFEVRYGLDSFTWREEGLFELTGTRSTLVCTGTCPVVTTAPTTSPSSWR